MCVPRAADCDDKIAEGCQPVYFVWLILLGASRWRLPQFTAIFLPQHLPPALDLSRSSLMSAAWGGAERTEQGEAGLGERLNIRIGDGPGSSRVQ